MGAAIATVFLARAFRHFMLFIYASEISDLTGLLLPRIEGFMPGWPVPYWRWGSDGIAIFYYRYWQYHVAERQ